MSIALSLAQIFGKPIAEGMLRSLGARRNGAARLKEAAEAVERGISATAALRSIFGSEFLDELNAALGSPGNSSFRYEAGTTAYVEVNDPEQLPVVRLRDELNINLDRLTILKLTATDLRNHCLGVMTKWKARCLNSFPTNTDDIQSTCATIEDLLKSEKKDYRDIYHLLSKTGLGGVGALMLISGVLTATSTGVGLVAAISTFLFGIPWLTVGALVLPGALLMALAAAKPRPKDEVSIAVALAYKLLERISAQN